MNGRLRVLAFSGHVADFCSRSGAMLTKCGRAWQVGPHHRPHLWWARRIGRPLAYPGGISVLALKQIRRREAEAAAGIFGGEIRFLGWENYPLVIDRQCLVQLAEQIREWRPEIELTHCTSDPLNQDHSYTAPAVLRAHTIYPASGLESELEPLRTPQVFLFESGVPQTDFYQLQLDVCVDVAETFEIKLQALSELKAQQESAVGTQVRRWRAWQARTYSGNASIKVKYAEAFKRY